MMLYNKHSYNKNIITKTNHTSSVTVSSAKFSLPHFINTIMYIKLHMLTHEHIGDTNVLGSSMLVLFSF